MLLNLHAFTSRVSGLVALVVLLAASVVSSGCGYALSGRGSFLPDYIRAVGVPPLVNSTTTFDLDRVLTDAIRSEFAGRGRYTIKADATDVDAVLIGTITAVHLDSTSFTANNQASRMMLTVSATFEFKDLRTNKVLWSNAGYRYSEQYDIATVTAGADAATFLGQDTSAMQRLSENFAKAVVTAILEAF